MVVCGLLIAALAPAAEFIDPPVLAARLASARAPKPKILYIGFGVLYRNKHIPGAVFAGPAAKPEGLELLRKTVANLPHSSEIILYCGCCPWDHCPNVQPAVRLMKELGFTDTKVLVIPTNFHTDWIAKGYPVETGQ